MQQLKALKWSLLFLCILRNYLVNSNEILEISNQFKAQALKIQKYCAKKVGVNLDFLKTLHSTGELPTEHNFKCFIHCTLETIGLIDSDNTVHLDYLVEILPPEIGTRISKLTDSCGTKPGDDGCDIAYQTIKCYTETDPDLMRGAAGVLIS